MATTNLTTALHRPLMSDLSMITGEIYNGVGFPKAFRRSPLTALWGDRYSFSKSPGEMLKELVWLLFKSSPDELLQLILTLSRIYLNKRIFHRSLNEMVDLLWGSRTFSDRFGTNQGLEMNLAMLGSCSFLSSLEWVESLRAWLIPKVSDKTKTEDSTVRYWGTHQGRYIRKIPNLNCSSNFSPRS